MSDRCIVHILEADSNIEKSVDDPRLTRLLADGWWVVSTIMLVDEDSEGVPIRNRIALLLAPPRAGTMQPRRRAFEIALAVLVLVNVLALALVAFETLG